MSSNIWEYLFKDEALALRLPEALSASDGLHLQSSKFGSIKVTAHIATAFGDNFTSDAYAVHVTEEGGIEHKAFVKVLPRFGMQFAGAMSQGLYQREIAIYNDLHTQLREIRKEASAPVPLNVPQLYYSIMDEAGECGANKTAVVLQDMKTSGFRTVDKCHGNSAKEAALAVRALARYHALTIALIHKRWRTADGKVAPPKNLEFTQHSIEFHERNYDMVEVSIGVWVRMAEERLGAEVAGWLDKEFSENGQKALKPESSDACEPLLCILHADCWSNNLMYSYDEEGEPADVCIVDWQITRIGHPATDILQYLFTSTTAETRKDHFKSLLNDYYSTLETSLKHLRCNILEEKQYDKERFLQDVNKRLRFGLFMSFVVLPAILDDSVFKAIIASRNESASNESNLEKAPADNPFDVEEIKKHLSVDKMMSNELLFNRIVSTISEAKTLIEKQTFT